MADSTSLGSDTSALERELAAAKRLQDQGRTSDAIAKYKDILANHPKLPKALMPLGKLYETSGQLNKAEACFSQIVDQRPNDIAALSRLGKVQLGLDRPAKAIASFNRAISVKADAPSRLYNNLGDALLRAGQPRQAAAAFSQALEKGSSSPDSLRRKIDSALNNAHDGPLTDIAQKIDDIALYSGGPVKDFGKVGRETIITLIQNGLRPDHKVLDFGCGAFRLGYWIIRLLDRGHYYGIEPHVERVEAGKKYALGLKLIKAKAPQISYNEDCDFSVFGVKFDYVVARSILSHTAPGMLIKILKSFRDNSSDGAIMLASYWPLTYPGAGEIGDDLPLSDDRFIKVVKFSFDKIQSWADEVGLSVSEYRVNPIINHQIWLKFEHKYSGVVPAV